MSADVLSLVAPQSGPLTLNQIVAKNVRGLLAMHEIPRGAVAERLGITPAALSMKLAGQRPIALEEVGKLATIFGVEASDLLREWAPWGSNPQPTDSPSAQVSGSRWAPGGSNPQPTDSTSSQVSDPVNELDEIGRANDRT